LMTFKVISSLNVHFIFIFVSRLSYAAEISGNPASVQLESNATTQIYAKKF